MTDEKLPQLKMRLRFSGELPAPALDEGMSVHTLQPGGEAIWEWIASGAFGRHIPFSVMRGEKAFSPERVFFVKEYSQDIATASAFFRDEFPGEGYVHMVATHPWCAGKGGGRQAVLAALRYFKEQGLPGAVLTTDDFRLPAIHEYLEMGFQPVCDEPSARSRWDAVLARLSAYEKPARETIPRIPGTGMTLTPFRVEGSRGAVVVCPGGGYMMKASHEGDPICRMLNAAGISAFTLDYRVYPNPVSAALVDAQRAIRTVRSLGYEKVGILGFSAGGHLSCMAATHYTLGDPGAEDPVERFSSRPDAFLPCYPLTSVMAFADQPFIQKLMRAETGNEYHLRYFSVEYTVTEDTPPAFIWHTFDDETVALRQSMTLAEALEKARVPFEYHLFSSGAHGLGLGGGAPGVEAWPALAQDWLKRQGFGQADKTEN